MMQLGMCENLTFVLIDLCEIGHSCFNSCKLIFKWDHFPSSVFTNQVNASSKPVPCIAEILNIDHWRAFKSLNPNPLKISCSVIAPGKSYLLASTRTGAPFNSSSCSIMSSSCFEYSRRSLSVESTTKITAFVS